MSVPKDKINKLNDIGKGFLNNVQLTPLKEAIWLKGYEHGVIATMLLYESPEIKTDLTKIRSLKDFPTSDNHRNTNLEEVE